MNGTTHELYTDGLRAAMERQLVVDAELSGLLDDLFRPGTQVGSASIAAAVRGELANPGTLVGGRSHIQKAGDYVRALKDWPKRNPTAGSGHRDAADNVIRNMQMRWLADDRRRFSRSADPECRS